MSPEVSTRICGRLHRTPGRGHAAIDFPPRIRPGVRVQAGLAVQEPLTDNFEGRGHGGDGQRDSTIPCDGIDRTPVALGEIGGVEEHRIALRQEFVDENVSGPEHAAVLFGRVFRLACQ